MTPKPITPHIVPPTIAPMFGPELLDAATAVFEGVGEDDAECAGSEGGDIVGNDIEGQEMDGSDSVGNPGKPGAS